VYLVKIMHPFEGEPFLVHIVLLKNIFCVCVLVFCILECQSIARCRGSNRKFLNRVRNLFVLMKERLLKL